VLNFIVHASANEKRPLPGPVQVMTAGAAPPAAIMDGMEDAGFKVIHTYGLTETYGPSVFGAPQDEWANMTREQRAAVKIRQGVRYPVLQDLEVVDPDTLQPVPRDGETIGEIMFKGNVVMRGYLKNEAATRESLGGGWFHSGDLGVMHPENYIQIKDRSKDIIISGGENISSIEVEEVLYRHPSVLEAAVVARPDEKWGETPCAFVWLKADAPVVSPEALIEYCREHMARFKAPKTIVFHELPKTSTGKIQKFKLRKIAEEMGSLT
jgi:fatty-acyl-CoA synthase